MSRKSCPLLKGEFAYKNGKTSWTYSIKEMLIFESDSILGLNFVEIVETNTFTKSKQ